MPVPAASGESLAATLASFPPGVQEALYGSSEALQALAAFSTCECALQLRQPLGTAWHACAATQRLF